MAPLKVVRFDATTLWHLDAAEGAPSTASFTSFPLSRRVRFAPRADIRPMPVQLQHGSHRYSSIGIALPSLNRRAAEAQAAGGEPIPAISGFRSLRTARAWLHGAIQRQSWRRVRAAAQLDAQCVSQREQGQYSEALLSIRDVPLSTKS